MRKLYVGRTITLIIAAIFIFAGVFFLVEARRIRCEFYKNLKEKTIDIPVDLSQPGEFSSTLKQTWEICDSQEINLYLPTAASQTSISELLASLKYNCQIKSSEGNIVVDANNESAGLPNGAWEGRPDNNTIPLLYFYPFDSGMYTLTLTVTSGAPKLAGMEQRLVGQYRPCGLEMLPAVLGIAFAIICFVIAAIILLILLIIIKKHKRKQIEQQKMGQLHPEAPDEV